MGAQSDRPALAWWRVRMVWLVIAGPALVVSAGVVTTVLAVRGADTLVTAAISAFANYSWQANPRPTGFDISELNLPPAHRFNVGVSGTRGRYFANMSASFVDGAFWQDVLPGYQGTTNAYTLVDGGIGVRSVDRRMTIAFRGKNLLNKPIQQHVFGDIIRRTVTGEVRFDF